MLTPEQLRRFYSSSAWQRARLVVLERDGYQCRIGGPSCEGAANEVDHIIGLLDGGPPLDADNLRASCKTCNNARKRQRRHPPQLAAQLAEVVDAFYSSLPPTPPTRTRRWG